MRCDLAYSLYQPRKRGKRGKSKNKLRMSFCLLGIGFAWRLKPETFQNFYFFIVKLLKMVTGTLWLLTLHLEMSAVKTSMLQRIVWQFWYKISKSIELCFIWNFHSPYVKSRNSCFLALLYNRGGARICPMKSVRFPDLVQQSGAPTKVTVLPEGWRKAKFRRALPTEKVKFVEES